MEKEEIKNKKQEEEVKETVENQEAQAENPEAENTEAESETSEEKEDKTAKELADAKEKYLRLYSDFENFRRRTAKEKLEFMKTANEGLLISLLAVLDDFDRAQKHVKEDPENEALTGYKQGVDLIQNKFIKVLEEKGLKIMEDPIGKEFDMDFHEAITQIPAPSEDMKGKVVDVVEKGYLLEDKVIRYAKVVVGS